MLKKICLKVLKFKRLGNVMLLFLEVNIYSAQTLHNDFLITLLITVTFYNKTMSISNTSKSFVKNKKKCNLFHYFHL